MMKLSSQQILDGWQPIATHPIDGTQFDVLLESGNIVREVFYGDRLMGKGRVLRGTQSHLSPSLKLLGWRKLAEKKEDVE